MSFDFTATDELAKPHAANNVGQGSVVEASKHFISVVVGNADPLNHQRQRGGVSITIRPDMHHLSASELNGLEE